VEFDKHLAAVGVAAPVASRYSRSVSQLRRVSINALEETLTSSSIICPPSIRCIKPEPFMSFYDQLPSLQHATMSASVKWMIAAHGRRKFSESGLKRQDNDLVVIKSAEAAMVFKRAFDARLRRRTSEGKSQ